VRYGARKERAREFDITKNVVLKFDIDPAFSMHANVSLAIDRSMLP